MGTTNSTATLIFSLLALLSLLHHLPTTTAIPETTVSAAAEILSNAGYNAMSLTLPLLSASLSTVPYATLFSPSDSAFSLSSTGQPSLSVLHFHFCPRIYSPADLLSLSTFDRLPTALSISTLAVTSSVFDYFIALNGVTIGRAESPLFDDGFFTVYTVADFFSPSFRIDISVTVLSPGPSPAASYATATPACLAGAHATATGAYWEAAAALRTRGYSRMAGFLDVQVSQFEQHESTRGKNVITVFAPRDEAMEGYFGNYSDWASVFLRHVVGCEMSWSDLVGLDDGVILGTLLQGFGIKIEKNPDGNNLVINGNFTVDFPDFYRSERILIHGLGGFLIVPTEDAKSANDQEVSSGGSYAPNLDLLAVTNHGEF